MASVGTIWAPVALRFLRVAVANTTKVVRTKIANTSKTLQGSIPHSVRSGYTGRQPIHPTALLRQQRRSARWFSGATGRNIQDAVKRFISTESGTVQRSRFDRSAPSIARHIAQASGRAPFSGALRPNLTGGALPRSAGGYGIGGSARYFSHTPAAPAQVVQNVSQAMRAFFLSGQKIRYDGVGPRGECQYRAVSGLEDKAMAKFASVAHSAPGAFIDFHLKPTVTALGPLAAAIAAQGSDAQPKGTVTLNGEGFLDVLSADFNRALKDINAIQADIQRLAILGDLPVVLHKDNTVRVRFPGVDAYTVERLCDDIGIQRGVIGQDPEFDERADVAMALRFPFAPQSDKTLTSPGGSARSIQSYEFEEISSLEEDPFVQDVMMDEMADNPWFSESEIDESTSPSRASPGQASQEFEGLEGIYRFLEECDRAKSKYH